MHEVQRLKTISVATNENYWDVKLQYMDFISTGAVWINKAHARKILITVSQTTGGDTGMSSCNVDQYYAEGPEIKSSQVYLFDNEFKRAVIINAMLNRNDKAMKALTVTLM